MFIKKIGDTIASRINPTRTHWSVLKSDLASRLRHFRFERDTSFQRELEENFTLLLRAWGIKREAEIPAVIADLRLRCPILLAPVLGATVCALCMSGLYGTLTLLLIAPPCLFGVLITVWRISILQKRAFTPLPRWMLSHFTKKNQRSSS